MPTFVRYIGRIMCAGDSITAGYMSLTGGWRKKFFADLAATGVKFRAVGPYTTNSPGMTATAHRGLSSESAYEAVAGLAATAATHLPSLVIYGWGMNDIGYRGRTQEQTLDAFDDCIDAVNSSVGSHTIFVQTVIRPEPPYYQDFLSVYDAVNAALPARVAAKGGTLIDIGSPALSDGVHPSDGASGYDLMATAIYDAVAAEIL